MSEVATGIEEAQEQTTSEAQALPDILVWSKACPTWQRDALRRLCTKGDLDEQDRDELTALCKSQGKGGAPLDQKHIPDPKAVTTAVRLRGLHGVENVNALKDGERLTFDKSGVTVEPPRVCRRLIFLRKVSLWNPMDQ